MKGRPVFVGCVAVLVLTACGGAGVSVWGFGVLIPRIAISSYCSISFYVSLFGLHFGMAGWVVINL